MSDIVKMLADADDARKALAAQEVLAFHESGTAQHLETAKALLDGETVEAMTVLGDLPFRVGVVVTNILEGKDVDLSDLGGAKPKATRKPRAKKAAPKVEDSTEQPTKDEPKAEPKAEKPSETPEPVKDEPKVEDSTESEDEKFDVHAPMYAAGGMKVDAVQGGF